MGRKYNTPYKKGKFGKTAKATKADYAKTAWKNLTENKKLWLSDTRKYDMPYKDTGQDFAYLKEGNASRDRFVNKVFKYKRRSKKRLGKKLGRENKHWRRYWRR